MWAKILPALIYKIVEGVAGFLYKKYEDWKAGRKVKGSIDRAKETGDTSDIESDLNSL